LWGSKQFAFRGLISCGQCGAGFTAQEKFKKLKSGEFNRHVYYSCTRRVDPNCIEKYINEASLCVLLQEFIEQNEKRLKIADVLRAKIERHFSATKSLFTHYKIEQTLNSPVIEYTRYVLDNGTESERTALAKGITSKLAIDNGALRFSNK
jgi:predicted metal-binding protein